MSMLDLKYGNLWERTLFFLVCANPGLWANAQLTEKEMLDQLIFGEDAPSFNIESIKSGEATEPVDSPPPSGLGAYHTGLPRWEKDFSIRLDLGYADNVLLSPYENDSSAFLRTSFDALLYKQPAEKGFNTYLYAFGEINTYEDVAGMDVSSLFMLQDELAWTGNDEIESGLQLKYTFYDQVYDASLNEFDQSSATVQANQFEIRPFLRSPVGEKGFVGVELATISVLYEDTAEDYTESHGRFFMGREYGQDSKVEIDLTSIWREYDERVKRTEIGLPMSGTLKRRSLAGGLSWTHYHDAKKTWSTRASGEFKAVMDNGRGYYDYNLSRGRISLTRKANIWKATATLGLSHYDYKKQRGDDGQAKLFRSTLETALSLERSFGENWMGFFEWQRGEDFSNQRGYEYSSNVVIMGGELSL